jgi:hypothetical protein
LQEETTMPKTTKKQPKQWIYSPRKPTPPKIPPALKAEVERKGQALVDTYLKPTFVKPPPESPRFNYIIDIGVKWYRSYFYFYALYAVPGPNALTPTFESKFARLTYLGADRFSLAFMRHTGEWIELYHDQPLDSSLGAIQSDPWFQLG